MKSIRLAICITLASAALLSVHCAGAAADSRDSASLLGSVRPAPDLTPAQVTRIQLEALRNNTQGNEGIELTYRFASPANRRVTGPLPRFVEMLRSPPYDRLLNHSAAEFGAVEIKGERALQVIVVTDSRAQKVGYLWVLARQPDGEYENCWMTEAVISTEESAPLRFAVSTPVHELAASSGY